MSHRVGSVHTRSLYATSLILALASLQGAAPPPRRQSIGLVLEGGGALGFAHIGVIRWLEEHHIPIDYVAGTSMGGLVGGLYAAGQSPAEIAQLTKDIDWNSVLAGQTPFQDLSYRRKQDRLAYPNRLEFGLKGGFHLPSGLNSGYAVSTIFDRILLPYYNLKSFNDLPIPFRCVATDMISGKKKVFDNGSLAQALRTTMSLPAIFSPIVIDGVMYTDGGAVDNLPVDVAKEMGADIVIAVYLDTGPGDPKGYDSILGAAGRNIEIMIAASEFHSIQSADILVSANLKGFTATDFTKEPEIEPKGYEAALKKQGILSRLSAGEEEWDRYVSERNSKRKTTVPTPQFLAVQGRDADPDKSVETAMEKFVGKPLGTADVQQELSRLMGLGYFNSLNYSLLERNGETGLLIRTTEKPYSPPFMNLAITIDGADVNDVRFGLQTRFTFQNVGSFRSEWRTDVLFGSSYGIISEYYRPLTATSKWFIAPQALITRLPYDIYSDRNRIAQYAQRRAGFGVDLGYAFGPKAELRIGESYAWINYKITTGVPTVPNATANTAITSARFNYFGQDDVTLPTKGFIQSTTFAFFNSGPGDSGSFSALELQQNYFRPVGQKGTVFVTADGGTTFGAKGLGLSGFALGGPLRMGAYGRNELLGNQYYLFQVGYDREIHHLNPLLGEGVYAVGFVETAKVYGNPMAPSTQPVDGSVALVVKSSIGPLFIGGSVGSNGRAKWWFGVGRIF
jgi:NTE family protein